MNKLRPVATPLVSVDPYFNIWSFTDMLYDDVTRHWAGTRNAMTAILNIDNNWYRIMGRVQSDNYRYYKEPDVIEQKSCSVNATETCYEFANEFVNVKLKFRTPHILDDMLLMSTPVSYISYDIKFTDGKKHNLKFYFDISSELCHDDPYAEVKSGKTDYSVFCGRGEVDVLEICGDDRLIDWGYLHLVAPGASCMVLHPFDKRAFFKRENIKDTIFAKSKTGSQSPVLASVKDYGEVSAANDFICVAYDDIYSIEYFGEKLEPYWKSSGYTFEQMVNTAVADYEKINSACDKFDRELRDGASQISTKYADLLCLAYRHITGAHKLVQKDGKLLYFSKECFSNGCLGTVDISYPSLPVFLCFNPKLAEGLFNAVFEYADGNHGWEYEFAPHDVGTYPKANGQAYGFAKDDPEYRLSWQMPVEECGNILISVAAICKLQGDASYAKENLVLLKKWADYLVKCDYDPQNQLCTDDFAGHLAHNCNLSVKGILGIASYGYILNMLGENGESYFETAKEFAKKWEENAFDGNCYRLSFDKPGTWSLKYNLVWDKFFDFQIFSEKVFKTETEFYKTKINTYGIPLDCRKNYTKSDWQMWTCCLSDDAGYRDKIINCMWDFVNSSPYRVPFSDWYETDIPVPHEFQHRAVQGGLFMPLLFKREK